MAKVRLTDPLTDDQVLNPEFFREDINTMYDDADKIENLATLIDDDLSKIYFTNEDRRMVGRGVLSFVAEQLKTLASLRTSKASAVNSIMSNKLKVSQLALSKLKNNEVGSGDADMIAREFQKLFLDPKNKSLIESQNIQFKRADGGNAKETDDTEDMLLSKRLKELAASGELVLTDNERVIKYEKIHVDFQVSVSDKDVKFIAVDLDTNEILSDYPETLLPSISVLENAVVTGTHYECPNGKKYHRYS